MSHTTLTSLLHVHVFLAGGGGGWVVDDAHVALGLDTEFIGYIEYVRPHAVTL